MKKILLTIILLTSAQCYAGGWEKMPRDVGEIPLSRKFVPHGWLVTSGYGWDAPITFVPDEKHEWKI